MIPSVTPIFVPSQVITPLNDTISTLLSQSKILNILPYLPFISIGIALITLPLAIYFLFRSLREYIASPKVLLELKPPHDTKQSAFSTEQLFTTLHSLGLQTTWWQCFLGKKKVYALELVASKQDGIRYCLRVYKKDADVIKKTLRAYIHNVTIKEIDDYLSPNVKSIRGVWNILSFKLLNHFALPLQKQSALTEHDPIAYITTHMTKLEPNEQIVYQILATPLIVTVHGKLVNEIQSIEAHIYQGFDITHKLNKRNFLFKIVFGLVKFFLALVVFFVTLPLGIFERLLTVISNAHDTRYFFPLWIMNPSKLKRFHELSPQQQYIHKLVQGKTEQELFEATVRVFLNLKSNHDSNSRKNGIITSFSPFTNSGFQALSWQKTFPFIHKFPLYWKYSYFLFKNRLLAFKGNNNTVLSVTELSSLFHFPYFGTTETEDMVNTKSELLPAPLSLKQKDRKLDIVFAKNTYGDKETPIGLTLDERHRHVYILGGTGTGKTTLLSQMIYQDIKNGKGVGITDPHGDLAEKIAGIISKKRKKDFIYFDPSDMDDPLTINLMELPKGLTGKKLAKEKDLIASSLISIFTKLYPPKTMGHRMENVLRNATLTALETENPTLFTIQKLLSDHDYRRSVVKTLTDEVLLLFWNKEFKKYGTHQEAEVISPITNKLGRFLSSPISRDILNAPQSTIDFTKIMDTNKIFIANLSKGKIGEDISAFFGALLTAKFQLCAYKRADIPEKRRLDFFLYIDEFQNFASPSFSQIMSEARKYHLNVILAHQTTAQIEDHDLLKIILANTGTIICFRNGSAFDEEFILPQYFPVVKKGDISNLPFYKFFIKINTVEPQHPFTGENVPLPVSWSKKTMDEMLAYSIKHYAHPSRSKDQKENPQEIKISNTKTNAADKSSKTVSKKAAQPKKKTSKNSKKTDKISLNQTMQ